MKYFGRMTLVLNRTRVLARFGSRGLRFWVPQKNEAAKGDISVSYLYVKWNSSARWFSRQRSSH
jgi:hypothetical protein